MGAVEPSRDGIRVNGEPLSLVEGTTVSGLLDRLDLVGGGVAVAVNHEVVPRGDYGSHVLQVGDKVEVIRAVGGG